MVTAHDLLSLARLYADAENVPLTTVSSRVFDDSKKLSSLQEGADLTLRRCGSALQWFSDHWPIGLAWPSETERPAPSQVDPSKDSAA
jgi:hypothetical protein